MKLWNSKNKRPKIGLALGSGGAHGLAHIGVIKALLDNNIPIDYIAGASSGALIGGLYAVHKDIDAVERIALTSDLNLLTRFMFDVSTRGGLLSGSTVEQFIRDALDDVAFDALHIPFAAVATDIHTGEAVVLRSGDVSSAIRASISVPVIFEPVVHEGRLLVDGGLVMPVPVSLVRDMGADIVIGVNLDATCIHKEHAAEPNVRMIIEMTMEILRNNLSEAQAQTADITVSPQFDTKVLVGWGEFLHAKSLIEKGQDSMEAELPRLKALLSKR
ncbi:hypothetical protein A2333_01005 [Candidatus Wolfebacteria bacterium RIFOXYB2_FULL_49_7]|uniref:PNPLA domain-containing protein n=1 Tax=Candidatus Wolfebacteria bacterium RIFOXYB1_FULL_54_12 TaxID=1802559 RepID=A0A1F8DX08_9BACT|nr:MAG: hypothetical protein A2372_01555 [Candidatus Wolfebacteria bacterium RIFOXYB1_FULL_54_12]OGM95579.1 MAG: hypothetical protein A2333_01005 [Candidatus Wolfebacteria bacterium RIFOXYB2_FULL_49_7]